MLNLKTLRRFPKEQQVRLLRMEVNILRTQLSASQRDADNYRREGRDLIEKLEQLRKEKKQNLMTEIGHILECNAKLTDAAAKILSPGTY